MQVLWAIVLPFTLDTAPWWRIQGVAELGDNNTHSSPKRAHWLHSFDDKLLLVIIWCILTLLRPAPVRLRNHFYIAKQKIAKIE
jgi:hypothetical protein